MRVPCDPGLRAALRAWQPPMLTLLSAAQWNPAPTSRVCGRPCHPGHSDWATGARNLGSDGTSQWAPKVPGLPLQFCLF